MKYIYTLFFLVLQIVAFSQSYFVNIGTGTSTNTSTTYPAPYGNWYQGAKHQMIIRAFELTASGAVAGNMISLGFNVAGVNGTALQGFSIALKLTNKSAWSSGDNFETGLTTVFSSSAYTEHSGWNTHTFSTPFYWDGVSNIIVETCFNNSSYTNNALTYYSSAGFQATMYHRQDDLSVCSTVSSSPNFFYIDNLRPNMKIEFQNPNIPPVADFSANTTSTCSGTISFTDLSANSPTSWLWDFGDGTTSTQQNPVHTYTATGVYTVTLTATNQYGSNTEVKNNYISVNLSGNIPIAPSCQPATQDGSLGFGITNVSFNTINESTGDASEGYLDNVCSQTTVFAGHTYPITIVHSQPTTHNCRAWIDYNNDGIFTADEMIIESTSALTTSGNVTISSTAVLNTPLRMRVIADYDLNPMPTPCANPVYGQAEDYTVIVEQDTNPPSADFIADKFQTCDGEISFTDLSTNIPNSWQWNFGDGTNSIQQNPTHTYTADGVYDVSLIVQNAFGADTLTQTAYVNVTLSNALTQAHCSPQTLGTCCGYGIYKVTLSTMVNSSQGAQEGYKDFSCEHQIHLKADSTYNFAVRTGSDNPQDTRAWIDFNNDGTFDNTEQVFEQLNAYNPQGSITIPHSNIVWDTPLRLRVLSDEIGSALNSCNDLIRGQVEDYGVVIEAPDTTSNSTAIAEQSYNKIISIFPNPAKHKIQVNSNQKIINIQLINILGEQIFTYTIQSDKAQLILPALESGVYILSINYADGHVESKRITVNQ